MKGLMASVARSDGRAAKSQRRTTRDGASLAAIRVGDVVAIRGVVTEVGHQGLSFRVVPEGFFMTPKGNLPAGQWTSAIVALPPHPLPPQSPGDKARDDHNPKADGEQD